jgi:predicted amidohydrolase YtcJ
VKAAGRRARDWRGAEQPQRLRRGWSDSVAPESPVAAQRRCAKKIVISGKVNLYLENFPDDNESTGVCESGWPPAAQGIGGGAEQPRRLRRGRSDSVAPESPVAAQRRCAQMNSDWR